MGTTRIIGHTVHVEQSGTQEGGIYRISGPDAELLHAICEHNHLTVSPFRQGAFTLTQATIDKERSVAGSHTRLYICNSVAEAALEQQLS